VFKLPAVGAIEYLVFKELHDASGFEMIYSISHSYMVLVKEYQALLLPPNQLSFPWSAGK
jgi:hypothetical protein